MWDDIYHESLGSVRKRYELRLKRSDSLKNQEYI